MLWSVTIVCMLTFKYLDLEPMKRVYCTYGKIMHLIKLKEKKKEKKLGRLHGMI